MTITTPHTALPDLSQAVYTALKADSTFPNLAAGPFDPPKEGQTFPFVSFGEHTENPWYTFGNTGREVTFMLRIYSQQQGTSTFGFKECYSILDAITNVLEAKTLTLTNFEMAQNGFVFDGSDKLPLSEDGITRCVVARYHTWLRAK
jgi:hypothetical protein